MKLKDDALFRLVAPDGGPDVGLLMLPKAGPAEWRFRLTGDAMTEVCRTWAYSAAEAVTRGVSEGNDSTHK